MLTKNLGSIILFFSVGFLVSCSPVNNSPKDKSVDENLLNSIPPKKVTSQIDFAFLFDQAEQEELELYNSNEQLLLANESVKNMDAKKFVESVLSTLEEGVQRKVLEGKNQGINLSQSTEVIIVIDSNIPDDSLESDIRFFELRKTQKAWSISAVSSVWKCYKNRGHQNYSTNPCE